MTPVCPVVEDRRGVPMGKAWTSGGCSPHSSPSAPPSCSAPVAVPWDGQGDLADLGRHCPEVKLLREFPWPGPRRRGRCSRGCSVSSTSNPIWRTWRTRSVNKPPLAGQRHPLIPGSRHQLRRPRLHRRPAVPSRHGVPDGCRWNEISVAPLRRASRRGSRPLHE
jgi:hypothetical protein